MDLESVDGLFGADIVDEIDKKTPDANVTFASSEDVLDDDAVEIDDAKLEELFGDFDDALGMDIMSEGMSGMGEADDGNDAEGVPIPDEILNPEKDKKDKRTARSQAHKKKKEQAAKDVLPMESGIFAEDEEFEPEILRAETKEEIIDFAPSGKAKQKKAASIPDSAPVPAPLTQEAKNLSPEIIYEEDNGYAGLPDEEISLEDAYEEVDLPDWADSIRRKVNANVAHAFLLNGNVRDYMVRNITIKDGIVAVLDGEYENFDIIAEYDQAHGIYFYGSDIKVSEGRMLADAYKERFIEEMNAAQRRLSLPQTEEIPQRDPVALFAIISDMFNHASITRKAKLLLFIDYSDLLVPDASSAQMKPDERKLAITLADIGRSQAADDAGNVMIFITDDMTQLSTRIRSAESRIEQIKIPIPNRDERADFIDNVLDVPENILSDGTQIFEHEDSISKETFAINSAGLSRIQIEDIMLRALSEDTPLTMQIMKERKQEIIREDYDDVLEIIDPKTGFERVGGMEHMKEFIREEIIEPVHAGEREAVPMGCLMMAPPGTGKSIPLNSRIFKKEGPVIASDITIGDMVFSRDGQLHTVLGVFPQGSLPVYEVELGDGRKVRCSKEHIWTVRYKSRRTPYLEKDMTVQDMLDRGIKEITPADVKSGRSGHSRFFVPSCSPVQYPTKQLSVDPYVMGAFLGDGTGTSSEVSMTCSIRDKDIIENMALAMNMTYKKVAVHNDSNIHWVFTPGDSQLEDMEKWRREQLDKYQGRIINLQARYLFRDYLGILTKADKKYIPNDFKYASIEQRYALIQGLMDTDGTIRASSGNRYNTEFSSCSKQLCLDVMEVLYSLGYTCTLSMINRIGQDITSKQRKADGSPYQHQSVEYSVKINIPNEEKHKLFRCKRKLGIALEAAKHPKRRHYEHVPIVDIRPLEYEEEMVCFLVDSPDHTYLVDDYVVTHNTMFSRAIAYEAGMNFVALNLNRIMEKWVGSTERNLDRALDCALAMAPTIIFIDEIDEALPNRADPNASSVNKRINQRLLTFFSDTSHRGEVIILAATNYPEKIDPAFKRAGRFDVRVPMFAPDEFDRMRIMRAIAKGRGYEFSWFEDPDEKVRNPFRRLEEWLREGNVPISDDHRFTGDREMYTYTIKDSLGNDERHDVYIPIRTIRIIDKEQITLQELYENVRILLPDLPVRQPDASTGEIETDEVFQRTILDYLYEQQDILGHDEGNIKELFTRIWRWEQIYSTFVDQTFRMTGAEMDVIMNKAINLYKKWIRKIGPDRVKDAINAGLMKHDHDIPWYPFLMDACKKTVNAVAGIKQMEDMALINTSDTDFIPDALYAQLDDGRVISYRERHEELTAKQEKSTLG